jgi:hypothetical protein
VAGWPARLALAWALAAAGPPALAQAAGAAMPAAAAASAPSVPSPPSTTGELAEGTQRAARATAEWLAHEIDSWFGDEPFRDVQRVTDGRFDIGLYKRQDQAASLDVRFDARFRLPNLERRAYVFIGRDDRREAVQDTPGASSLRQRLRAEARDDRSFLAGLGLQLPRGLDARVGLTSRARAYAQLRWRKGWQLTPAQHLELRETLFLTRADRLGSTTALAWEVELAPLWALRWLNAGTITQASRNLEWSSSLNLYRQFSGARVLSAEALLAGEGTRGTGTGYSDAGLLLKWEQPLHADMLRGELVLGHFWPRPDRQSERGRAWALGATLKMRF